MATEPGPTLTSAPHRAGQVASRRVLVVDDNVDAAELMARALVMMGHEAEVVVDGPSALSRAASFQPDVVLLDIGLPVMDGYEVARRLKREIPTAYIVAVTGYGQASDEERSREAGFDRHVVKPVELAVVRDIVMDARPA